MGLRVPRLDEVLDAFAEVPYVIEIKQGTPSIVEPFLQTCADKGVLDRMVASAFDVNVLEELRAADPDLPTSFGLAEVVAFLALTPETEAAYAPPAEFLQVPPVQGGIPVLTPAFIERADRFDLKVHAWTINEPAEMQELIDLGVDGIITDYPARLRDLVGG
jgi:glycerophosphoryl diester phosphodiesterase